ncbi:MAG: DUF6198 family protein [Candidatus Borkfalkiaceae bacterium]|nr:DUF6198 family protein [Clostridia bacterium]MDY6224115.1 DUF6198 family protein [Christensenellaceae bacterium]
MEDPILKESASGEKKQEKHFRKFTVKAEAAYVLGVAFLALAVAMCAAADFGVSMIVAPAYILSLKVSFLSFGRAEYLVQAVLFIALCIVLKKVRFSYFFAFFTCIFYGAALDLIRLIPFFSQSAAGAAALPARIALFIGGMALTSFSVMLSVKTYLYPQVYDFFVKQISKKFSKPLSRIKTAFDASFLLLSCALSFALFGFGNFKGIGWGTLIITACNGPLIGLFGKLFDKYVEITPIFPRFSRYFD